MALTARRLAEGQLPAETADLYVAAGTALVKTVTVTNAGAAGVAVNLSVRPAGGTARRIVPKDLALAAGATLVVDSPLVLEAGDALRGDASLAGAADYYASGVTEG